MDRLKRHIGQLLLLTSTSLLGFESIAQEYSKPYKEPSRGFFIEHGVTNSDEYVSLELHTGSGDLDNGGGVRLGLPQSELIINSGLGRFSSDSNYNANTNEALFKYSMPPVKLSPEQQNQSIDWALIGGIATIDRQTGIDQTSLKLGGAVTVMADAGTFTLAPYMVFTDSDNGGANSTFIELDFGAYVRLIDTKSGLFSAGFEMNYSSQFRVDEQFSLGLRWLYNENVNLDIIPIIYNNNDVRGIPGLVRLNINF